MTGSGLKQIEVFTHCPYDQHWIVKIFCLFIWYELRLHWSTHVPPHEATITQLLYNAFVNILIN